MPKTTKSQPAPKTAKVYEIRWSAELGESYYGHHEPRLNLSGYSANGRDFRAARAELYRMAAKVELATPAGEAWCVVVDTENNRIKLELVDATKAEADRGMAALAAALKA